MKIMVFTEYPYAKFAELPDSYIKNVNRALLTSQYIKKAIFDDKEKRRVILRATGKAPTNVELHN